MIAAELPIRNGDKLASPVGARDIYFSGTLPFSLAAGSSATAASQEIHIHIVSDHLIKIDSQS